MTMTTEKIGGWAATIRKCDGKILIVSAADYGAVVSCDTMQGAIIKFIEAMRLHDVVVKLITIHTTINTQPK